MAKKARVWDGANWQELASAQTDLTGYANLSTTPISGFRNAIINGGFDIWQRGTSFSLTPTNYHYTADRWDALAWTGATVSVSRQNFTPGAAPTSGYEGTYFLRYTTTDTVNGNIVRQKIENVCTFAGQTVTLSFWARIGSGSGTISSDMVQSFGTGGSADVGSGNFTFTDSVVTTSWKRFTATITLASISGKTIGSNSYLMLAIKYAAGNNTLDIWGVQLERGTIATPFEQRPIGTEISLCQRYFCKSFPIDVAPANNLGTGPPGGGNQLTIFNTTVGNSYSNFQRFPVPMRRAPDMVAFNSENANAGSWSIYNSAGALNSSYATTAAFSPHHTGFLVSYGGLTTVTVANGAWTASAEL